jgi:hypothetical protein
MKLLLEVEVPSVKEVISFCVSPLQSTMRLVTLVILAIELVTRSAFLPLPVKQVLQEMALVG